VILGSNDGSHFLLARSIAAGQLKITPERMPYTGYVSFAEYKGDKYSDRPPGLALLATPAYLAAKGLAHTHSFQLNPPEAETLLGGEKINSEDFFPLRSFGISLVHLIPIILSAVTLVLLFNFLNLYTTHLWLTVCLTGLFGLGTLFLKYATVFYSHNVSAFMVMSAVWLFFQIKKTNGTVGPLKYKALGACLGCMALLEYQMIIFGLGILIAIAIDYKNFFRIPPSNHLASPPFLSKNRIYIFLKSHSASLSFLFWASLPVLMMGFYQAIMFGNPLLTTYANHGFYLYAHTFGGLFSGSVTDGLLGLLFLPDRHGLFFCSPFILIGVVLSVITIQRYRFEKLLFLIIGCLSILLVAMFREWHGGGFYPRYIIWPSLLLFLAGSLWFIDLITRLSTRSKNKIFFVEVFALILFFIAALYGIYTNFIDMPDFYNATKIQNPENLDHFTSYFPGLIHWPLLLLIIVTIGSFHYRKIFFVYPSLFTFYNRAKLFSGVAFLALVLLLVDLTNQVPDWRRRTIIHLDNFHTWEAAKSYKSTLSLQTYETRRIKGGHGIVYPENFDEPGVLVYLLPPLKIGKRIFLVSDVTLTGVPGSRANIEVIDSSGTVHPISNLSSDGIEKRYRVLVELSGFDVTKSDNLIKFSLTVLSGSKTVWDVRLESLEIYAI